MMRFSLLTNYVQYSNASYKYCFFRSVMNKQFEHHHPEYVVPILACIIPKKFGSILIVISSWNNTHTILSHKKNWNKNLQPTTNKLKDVPKFYVTRVETPQPSKLRRNKPGTTGNVGTFRRPLPLPPSFKGGGRLSAGAMQRITCFRWWNTDVFLGKIKINHMNITT